MSQVIGQAWKEVVGCRNCPVMRVPQFIALRRNEAKLDNKISVFSIKKYSTIIELFLTPVVEAHLDLWKHT